LDMGQVDANQRNATGYNLGGDVPIDRQLSERFLDSDFPKTDDADDQVLARGDDFCLPRWQPDAVGGRPDQRARVEEIAPSHLVYWAHSGPSSSKSSAIQTVPSNAPSRLAFVEAAGGNRRATTLP